MTIRGPTDLQSHQPVTILEAVGVYVRSFKKKDSNSPAQQELLRFANWCGVDKVITDIGPPEIGASLAGPMWQSGFKRSESSSRS